MSIDDASKQLESEKKGGTKNIIFAYWVASDFDRKDDEDWGAVCEIVEDKMDWSYAHDQMNDLINLSNSDTN